MLNLDMDEIVPVNISDKRYTRGYNTIFTMNLSGHFAFSKNWCLFFLLKVESVVLLLRHQMYKLCLLSGLVIRHRNFRCFFAARIRDLSCVICCFTATLYVLCLSLRLCIVASFTRLERSVFEIFKVI